MENKMNFGRHHDAITRLIDETSQLVEKADLLGGEYDHQLKKARRLLESDARLRISLVGEYSAGKSSLINALTGAEATIDADVETTEIESYEWNGIEWIDTPGIQSQIEEANHDRIARDATIDSDLVIFVATASGFNDRLARTIHESTIPQLRNG